MNKNIWMFSLSCMLLNPLHSVASQSLCSNEITAGAIFLRSGGSNDYGVLVYPFNPNLPAPILSPNWEPKGIDPDFSPGFTLALRHVFEGNGTDIQLYWAHLRTSDLTDFPVNRNPPPAQQMAGPFWNIGPDSGTTSSAVGQLRNSYDVLNLEVGKQLEFATDLQMRLFAGLSALWVHQKNIGNFAGIDPILGPYTFGISSLSKYNAGGLRFGFEGDYNAFNRLSLVTLVAGNIFIGSMQPGTDTVGTGLILSTAGIPVNNQSIWHRSYVQMVPGLDFKLGLKYCYQYAQVAFAAEAGYMGSIYVNALQNYVPDTYAPGSLGIVTGSMFLQSLMKTTDSFSVDGPYLSVSLRI